jgi:hypothetical protein
LLASEHRTLLLTHGQGSFEKPVRDRVVFAGESLAAVEELFQVVDPLAGQEELCDREGRDG